MRSSLTSATSLLALLLLDGRGASAGTISAAPSISFGDVLVSPGVKASGSDLATATGVTATVDNFSFSGASTLSAFTPGSIQSITGSKSGSSGNFTYTGATSATYYFSPAAIGSSSTTVTVTDTAGSASTTIVLSGTGVAPSISGPATSVVASNYVLVGQSSLLNLSVSNGGNGNLAPTVVSTVTGLTLNNLNGSFGVGNSVFVGTGTATFSLTDNSKGTVLSTSSSTYAYAFKPTITGTSSTNVVTTFSNGTGTTNLGSSVTTTLTGTGVAPLAAVTAGVVYGRIGGAAASTTVTVANIGNGNLAPTVVSTVTGLTLNNLNGSVSAVSAGGFSGGTSTIALASNATSTLGYTYTPTSARGTSTATVAIAFSNGVGATNAAQTVSTVLTGSAVGPTYASYLSTTGSVGSFPSNTPSVSGTGGSVAAAGSTINFGTVGKVPSQTVYLALQNTTTDGGAALLTDLTIDKYTITGVNASLFSISSIAGSVITEGGTLLVPITVSSTSFIGTLNSTLTIFTDESVALGGAGDTFTYALTAYSVPEPTSLAVLGIGLAGLASFRRRRQARGS